MFERAISETRPLASTEPCVVTPPAVTVCARMKPWSALTLMLAPAPVALSALKMGFSVAFAAGSCCGQSVEGDVLFGVDGLRSAALRGLEGDTVSARRGIER